MSFVFAICGNKDLTFGDVQINEDIEPTANLSELVRGLGEMVENRMKEPCAVYDGVYEVEEILAVKPGARRGSWKYLVKYKGYDSLARDRDF